MGKLACVNLQIEVIKMYNPSTDDRRSSQESSKGFGVTLTEFSGSTPSPSRLESGSNASISSAFRQLQHKCRNVEAGRADSLRELAEMKRLMNEQSRRDSLLRSRTASHANETLQEKNDQSSKIQTVINSLQTKLSELERHCHEAQDDVFEKQRSIEAEERALEQSQAQLLMISSKNRDYERETEMVRERVAKLEEGRQQRALQAAELEAVVKESIVGAGLELTRAKQNHMNTKARAGALQTYLRLLLNINRDLCDAVQARERAEQQMKKFVIIPRYSWPKGKVAEATEMLTGVAAEHALDIQRRREMRKTPKAFKDGSLGGTSHSRPALKKDGRCQKIHTPLKQAEKATRKAGVKSSRKRGGNALAVQHDTALKAVSSQKVGQSVRSIAGYLRPKTY